MIRKYSDAVIKKRIEMSREKVIKDLKTKNIPFELIGTNYVNRATPTDFRCLKCGGIKIASAHNIINNTDGCIICGKKKKRSYNDFKLYAESQGYELLSSPEEIKGVATAVNTNTYAVFKHSCGTVFKLKIHKFLEKGNHCPKCNHLHTTDEQFLSKLSVIYGDLFSLAPGTHYNGRHNPISLKCKKCGNITTDIVSNFLTNHRGCNYCNGSNAEKIIINHFSDIKHNISFSDMKLVEILYYDFERNNIFLECDGKQHFEPVEFFGGPERFETQQTRDFIKDKYSLDHNLTLIRIMSSEITAENINMIFNVSTTIEDLNKIFENILVIKNGKIQLLKGKYALFKIANYIQVNGNEDEKDIV